MSEIEWLANLQLGDEVGIEGDSINSMIGKIDHIDDTTIVTHVPFWNGRTDYYYHSRTYGESLPNGRDKTYLVPVSNELREQVDKRKRRMEAIATITDTRLLDDMSLAGLEHIVSLIQEVQRYKENFKW